MSGVFVLPRETNNGEGLIAVGERLLLKLDGDTARVLGVAPLRTLREFGTPGRRFAGAVALEPPLIVAQYQRHNALECWNCKNGKCYVRVFGTRANAHVRQEKTQQLEAQVSR